MQLWAFLEKEIYRPKCSLPHKQTTLEDLFLLLQSVALPWFFFPSLPSGTKGRVIMSISFVQAEKLRPTAFEVEYFDQYDFYSLTDRYSGRCAGKAARFCVWGGD